MRAAQGGDGAAYADLLRRSLPFVARVVRAQRAYGVEIDDIVQDVLLSLHAVRHTYDPDRPFSPWLAAIARNRVIDAQRKRGRIARNEESVAELPETFLPDHPNTRAPDEAEALRHAVADLPPGQRQAVEMLKLRELSLKEAAAASGMSIAALKVAVHRGVKALRLRLSSSDEINGGVP
ncbi:MAG: sigma-70 family RNA polymerase sigma factor [Alphaproteobacteria bacterium]|nr:sigma-70 family RNA polymerase sigma factor [Alphaproteobacteria bacterium]MBL6938293.1 sigma-70 family RNA polymerase sigma factor [Alphaproteobacteria bacterium]MBL7097349.1 sigma-70 family RNA polymerase sigma factor [Alphaproteobacteria bacterium]